MTEDTTYEETNIGRPRKPIVRVPEYDELVTDLSKVMDETVRNIFATKYITGGRLNEWPLKIRIKEKNGNEYLMITLTTLKNPTQKLRTIPVDMSKEQKLLGYVKQFWDKFQEQKNFWGTDRTLERWYKKYISIFYPSTYPHFLREFRIHHVISDNDRLGLPTYREDQLCQYFGWSDFDSAKPYRHLREANLI